MTSAPIRSRPDARSFWKGLPVFGGDSKAEAPPPVDVKELHAKIGELTLTNDFLTGALTKAGLLSAKR